MKRTWQAANILSLIFALVANYLVGTQLIGLSSINEISNKYATFLTPAGYAFSIWSLIYVMLIVFVVYQARDLLRPRSENDLPQKIGPFFVIANICNGLWTYVFVNEMVGLSLLIIVLLAVSLHVLIKRLRIALDDTPITIIACVWWPLLIYAGWVTVATIVNAASWADKLGIETTPLIASGILVGMMGGLLWLMFTRNVRELVLASVWGIVAIGIQQGQEGGNGIVASVAFSVAGVLLVGVLYHAYLNGKLTPPLKS